MAHLAATTRRGACGGRLSTPVDPSASEAFLAAPDDLRVSIVQPRREDRVTPDEAPTAETLVRVSWYRVENGDLKNTLIKQSWKQVKGDWRLVEESRADGDAGLIGDPAPPPAEGSEPGPAPKKHFPTIRLGSTENAPAAATE